MKRMQRLKAIMQGMLHPRSAKKSRLWSMGVVLLFCVVCILLATGSIPSSAFAAEDTASQQTGQMQPHDSPGSASATWTPSNPIAANSTLMFFTDPTYTSSQPAVSKLWSIMLGIADVCVVLVLMLNGILVMLGGSVFRYSKAIEAIPRVLLAIIVAHLSMTFITLTLDLNNELSRQLSESTQRAQFTSISSMVYKEQFLVIVLPNGPLQTPAGWTGYSCDDTYCWESQEGTGDFFASYAPGAGIAQYDLPPSLNDCVSDGWPHLSSQLLVAVVAASASTFLGVMVDCSWPRFTITPPNIDFTKLDIASSMKSIPGALDLMIDIMGLMLIAQVVIRIFYIDVYIVFAAMGIGCWALPADIGRGVTSMWFKGFISTVMVQFVQMTAIIVTQLILGSLLDALTGTGKISSTVLSSALLDKLVNVAMLWFIFRIPAMFNTAPMRSMVEIGQTMSQTVSAFVGMQIAETQTALAETWGAGEAAVGIGAMFLAK